ncbi:hypothetical protein L2E82_37751 [Cichorium intybus]|uniref:Uncharacterized protein n=1 Tax=Cichorium intybus TaxID=13427 RepID=A0ACB9AE90_CICIN|nr:hypothetical protein L2E82_37751 [Cichorium intybus]
MVEGKMEKSCNSNYPAAGGRSAAEAPAAAAQCFRDFESEEKEKKRDRDRHRSYANGPMVVADGAGDRRWSSGGRKFVQNRSPTFDLLITPRFGQIKGQNAGGGSSHTAGAVSNYCDHVRLVLMSTVLISVQLA